MMHEVEAQVELSLEGFQGRAVVAVKPMRVYNRD
jgi:hypothetical protein